MIGRLIKYEEVGAEMEYTISMITRLCNILQFFTAVKMVIFRGKIVIFFPNFAQNIDLGYTLELPHWPH